MLECEAPGSDQAVKDAARVVREGVATIDDTYDISLAVMFLDRLGEAGDNQLVTAAAKRLVAGQTANGGWGYNCPKAGKANESYLRTVVKKRNAADGDKPSAPSGPRPGCNSTPKW